MERLTREKRHKVCDGGKHPTKYTSGHTFQEVVARLAAYEDTGLEPEEVVALQASNQEIKKEALPLLQAKIQDRLAVLPCKLGDTVYATFRLCGGYLREKNKPYPCEVVFIGISKEPFIHIQFESGQVFPVDFETIGKTVFTTKEAAEAALKEREG